MQRALIVEDQNRSAEARKIVREKFIDSLTLVPFICLTGSIILGILLHYLDAYLANTLSTTSWFVGTSSAVITTAATIATSMITFLTVVFSMTLVALQLASQQFSPRVLRIFVRSTVVKLTLGLFIATFTLAMVLLAEGVRSENAYAPLVTLTVSILLVFTCTIVFVIFVRTILTMIRVAYIISIIADETSESIAANFPMEDAYRHCEDVSLDTPKQTVRYSNPPQSHVVSRLDQGVIKGISSAHLVKLARDHDCVVRIRPRVGDYVATHMSILDVYGAVSLPEDELLSAFSVGAERTLYQDPAFGIRELVDIAAQALSPAVNAPTTATQVIYRITDLMLEIARRPMPSGYYADPEKQVRLVRSQYNWEDYVELAFSEIIEYGASSSQVYLTLTAAFESLLEQIPADFRPPIERQREALVAAIK